MYVEDKPEDKPRLLDMVTNCPVHLVFGDRQIGCVNFSGKLADGSRVYAFALYDLLEPGDIENPMRCAAVLTFKSIESLDTFRKWLSNADPEFAKWKREERDKEGKPDEMP
jgi:hypothetical protein